MILKIFCSLQVKYVIAKFANCGSLRDNEQECYLKITFHTMIYQILDKNCLTLVPII